MGADLTDDEIAGLEITDSCGCSIGREVQRRRAAHTEIAAVLDLVGASEVGRITFDQYHGILAEMYRAEGK